MSGASKRVIQAYHLATDKNALTTFTSDTSIVGFLDNYTLEFIFTGTPNGTIDVQESVAGTSWTTIYTITITAGAPSPVTFERNQCGGRHVRFVYTTTGGSAGTLNAYIQAKEI